jgi:transcriptional regulator with XRE-family HTH domain
MTLADIRLALRAERVRRKRSIGLTLDRLQDASGVDRAAIHRIESVEKYPDYEPGMQTILRLVEGMGLTLYEFFLRIESPTRNEPPVALQTGEPLSNTALSTHTQGAASHGIGTRSAAASYRAELAHLRREFKQLETDLRRMEARDRAATAPRGKKAAARQGVRPSREKAS